MTESSPLRSGSTTAAGPEIPIAVEIHELEDCLRAAMQAGRRLGLLTARPTSAVSEAGSLSLTAVLIDPASGSLELWESKLPPGADSFPSLTHAIPQAHWFERAIADLFGLTPRGHPRLKSVVLHEAWPHGYYPLRDPFPTPPDETSPPRNYEFLSVKGEGIYEVPVGPIHAGIIEPGHFRFSCLGEVIHNLEIRLGYVHRGVEEALTRIPWQHARFTAEAASSDTTLGNALAHATAIEQILQLAVPTGVVAIRAAALEMERIACHIGDLGGICSDIGFGAGASVFGRLRGTALGLVERLTGARFGASYIIPGGVSRSLTAEMRSVLREETARLLDAFNRGLPILLENAGALERMEGTGWLRPALAREFGLVGPAGRASGVDYDVRRDLRQAPYESLVWEVPCLTRGDVLSRIHIRSLETGASLSLLSQILSQEAITETYSAGALPASLPANAAGIGVVEAWRGELIHLVFTDGGGQINRYCIKDPSFQNWTGLSIAARGELLSDFPMCNKSFGLSYSGNDL